MSKQTGISMVKKKKISRVLVFAFIWLTGIFFILPVFIAILNSFKTQGEIILSAISLPKSLDFSNYMTIIQSTGIVESFLASVLVTGMTVLLVTFFSSLAGYALARWKSRWSSILTVAFSSVLFVPFQIYMIALILTAKDLHCTNNIPGLILVNVGISIAIPVFLSRSYVRNAIPLDIEEAAIIDGCGMFNLYFKIVLPLMKPVLATIAIITGLWAWNDFLTPLLIYGNAQPRTLPLTQQYFFGLYSMKWNLIMSGFVLTTIPAVIFFLFMQKFIINGLTKGAVKG
jgi:raffinose/stachyose/melibiose transport system permease protein